ncbi:hypothetical protein DBV15_08830 [Temnothorax longispinosus]|uniref:Uncharacterized protein n=1 Tax=Temnothorax longispinosus TaxID=300112 RepID=A0A4S2JCK1_9HYME|nr:hypothetical protein DBV15_08830 [Temnothorax longispinosus]
MRPSRRIATVNTGKTTDSATYIADEEARPAPLRTAPQHRHRGITGEITPPCCSLGILYAGDACESGRFAVERNFIPPDNWILGAADSEASFLLDSIEHLRCALGIAFLTKVGGRTSHGEISELSRKPVLQLVATSGVPDRLSHPPVHPRARCRAASRCDAGRQVVQDRIPACLNGCRNCAFTSFNRNGGKFPREPRLIANLSPDLIAPSVSEARKLICTSEPFLTFPRAIHSCNDDDDDDGGGGGGGRDDDEGDEGNGARGKKLHGYLLVCFCGLSSKSVITLMIPSCPFPHASLPPFPLIAPFSWAAPDSAPPFLSGRLGCLTSAGVTSKEETSPTLGFPTHFASITQFFSGGKKTADALLTLFLLLTLEILIFSKLDIRKRDT